MITRFELPAELHAALVRAAGGSACYFVGGTVRDLLLGRRSADLDIAVSAQETAFARRLAASLGGAAVPLDAERGMLRVALPAPIAGYHHIDVARLRADGIAADLALRDFTINAIAVDLANGHLIDPLGGRADLEAGLLRLAGADAVRDDPLRSLRAVRFAAELGFTLEPRSAELIRRDAALLSRTAGERQRDEFMRVLNTPAAAHMLRLADDLGVLDALLPELVPAKGCTQPKEHYFEVFDHLIATVAVLDTVLASVPPAEPHEQWQRQLLWDGLPEGAAIHARMDSPSAEGRTWRAVLKLVGLLHDVSKPETRTRAANGRVRFFGHAELGAEKAEAIAGRLRLTSREARYAGLLVREHLRPGQLTHGHQLPTKRALYRFFRDLGEAAPDLLLLNLADHAAARGPLMPAEAWAGHVAYVHWILNQRTADATLVRPVRLLTGHDLIHDLGLSPGPAFRRILDAVLEAQAVGRVTTREGALRLAGRLAAAGDDAGRRNAGHSPSPANLSS